MLSNCLSTMKQVFMACVKEKLQLDSALRKYFAPALPGTGIGGFPGGTVGIDLTASTVLQAGFCVCGVCNQRSMTLRQSIVEVIPGAAAPPNLAPQKFLYCTICKQSLLVPKHGEITPLTSPTSADQQPVLCPICKYQVLTVSKPSIDSADSKKKTNYHICSYCFR